MIRATLLLATALLLGLGGVVWVARDLDPLRVIERFAPARVRTVDLTGSQAFVRREPAASPAPSGPPVASGPPALSVSDPRPRPESRPGARPAREVGPAPAPASAIPAHAGPVEFAGTVEVAEAAGVAKAGEVADPAAGTPAPTAVAVEVPEVVIDVPGLAAHVVDYLGASLGSNAAFEEALEPGPDPDAAAEATAGADAPAALAAVPTPEPLDPDASAELVRRMLAVYERAGERR